MMETILIQNVSGTSWNVLPWDFVCYFGRVGCSLQVVASTTKPSIGGTSQLYSSL